MQYAPLWPILDVIVHCGDGNLSDVCFQEKNNRQEKERMKDSDKEGKGCLGCAVS